MVPVAREGLRFGVPGVDGEVSARLLRPPAARCLLVLAHGAGADMNHPFMESAATLLHELGIASLRFQFPYAERGRRRPDARRVLLDSIRAAVSVGADRAGDLPLFAGGKSMGEIGRAHV